MARYGQGAPPGWRKFNQFILDRAHGRCQIGILGVCIGAATQVDHKINLATLGIPRNHPASMDPENCQAACEPCHEWKSERERIKALAEVNRRRAAERRVRLGRKPQKHPGDD